MTLRLTEPSDAAARVPLCPTCGSIVQGVTATVAPPGCKPGWATGAVTPDTLLERFGVVIVPRNYKGRIVHMPQRLADSGNTRLFSHALRNDGKGWEPTRNGGPTHGCPGADHSFLRWTDAAAAVVACLPPTADWTGGTNA